MTLKHQNNESKVWCTFNEVKLKRFLQRHLFKYSIQTNLGSFNERNINDDITFVLRSFFTQNDTHRLQLLNVFCRCLLCIFTVVIRYKDKTAAREMKVISITYQALELFRYYDRIDIIISPT